jgi:hypothetical protein
MLMALALVLAPMVGEAHCNLGLPSPIHCAGNGSTEGWIAVQLPGHCVGIGGNVAAPPPYVINTTTCQ